MERLAVTLHLFVTKLTFNLVVGHSNFGHMLAKMLLSVSAIGYLGSSRLMN